MRARKLVIVTLLLGLLSSCAAILGLDPLEPYLGDETEAGAGEGGGAGSDAAMGGTVVGEAGVAPCSPDDQPLPPVVYVSAKAGDAGAPTGSADQPYSSIMAALPLARLTEAKTIALDEGTYVEDVTLDKFVNPIKIDGAWIWSADGTWKRDCSPDRRMKTVIRSTRDMGLLVQDQAGVRVTVSNLTIEAREPATTAPNTSGASRYGVFVDRSLLWLENVRVVAPAGDHGGPASPGTPGVPKCTTTSDCVLQPAAGVSPPNAAPASTFGRFEASGFVPGDGAAGADGTEGTNGTPGGPGRVQYDCFNGCRPNPDCGEALPGLTVSTDGGTCGCGGTGGKKGEPGRGGGASIGIYAVGSASIVIVKYSELVANRGGDGSPGGQGGAGGPPTVGVAGQSALCYAPGTACCKCGTCPSCGCYAVTGAMWPECCGPRPQPQLIDGGRAGGDGMPGGKGANGGGGAGGPSFSYVTVDGAQVQAEETDFRFFPGGVGAGGAPSGPSGVHP